MKKIFILLFSCTLIFTFSYSQCEEVKKVVTNVIGKRIAPYLFKNADVHSFEFKNLNNFEVFMEAEIRMGEDSTRSGYIVVDTKSFMLGANETFVWENIYSKSMYNYLSFKAFKCP
jgi:hypothetical protein